MTEYDARGRDMTARLKFLRKKAEEQMTGVPMTLRYHPKDRVWFYKPSWYWFGWQTLIPFLYGHDEYSRRTLVLGWTVTGRIVFALWYCGDQDCYEQSVRWILYDEIEDADDR